MKHRVATLLAGLLLVGPAPAVQAPEVTTIQLSEADQARCNAEGGCALVSLHLIQVFINAERARALQSCKESL